VSVLLGNGDGTFQAAVNYGHGQLPDLGGDWGLQRRMGSWTWSWPTKTPAMVSVLLGNGEAPSRHPSATPPVPARAR